jgi:alkylation response protein AidB-like acyl-CoA dehydrogenase
MWITNGGFADLFIVFAKVDGEKFSAFIVEKGFPGFSIGAEEKKMGIRGSSTTPIILNDCKVPVENLLGEIGKGHVIAFNTLNIGRFAGAVRGRSARSRTQSATPQRGLRRSIAEFG